ncbi:GGDEF domain-containing protein [Alteromonadaceae bacterium BrNp21-10]|nr:GGDEF domain-containing protein [Alteromonadaceae bacterium BrNp21-10]
MAKVIQHNKTSTLIIVAAVTLLGAMAALLYIAHQSNVSLLNSPYIINTTGQIRGGIQRISKLKTGDCQQHCAQLINDVDHKIEDIIKLAKTLEQPATDNDIVINMQKLKPLWEALKLAYQTPDNHQQIMELSEQAWNIADTAVLSAQHVTENNVTHLIWLYPLALLIILANGGIVFLAFTRVRKILEHRSIKDAVTGLFNRYAFLQMLDKEVARANRHKRPFSLLYFDIDYFKEINDKHGHQIGDETLKTLADLVASIARNNDIVSRIGGEEFTIIAPEATQKEAQQFAEKIRQSVAEHEFPKVGKLTISIGVAQHRASLSAQTLLQYADTAMYEAKNGSRNCVKVFEFLPESV